MHIHQLSKSVTVLRKSVKPFSVISRTLHCPVISNQCAACVVFSGNSVAHQRQRCSSVRQVSPGPLVAAGALRPTVLRTSGGACSGRSAVSASGGRRGQVCACKRRRRRVQAVVVGRLRVVVVVVVVGSVSSVRARPSAATPTSSRRRQPPLGTAPPPSSSPGSKGASSRNHWGVGEVRTAPPKKKNWTDHPNFLMKSVITVTQHTTACSA